MSAYQFKIGEQVVRWILRMRQRRLGDPKRRYYLLGRDRTFAELQAIVGANVLEIGGGRARNGVRAARRDLRVRCDAQCAGSAKP